MKKIYFKAFTLAEVLITLGIIGIVAAMTMPSLIAKYQKQVWVNQLKKSYSTLSQAFQKILADEGVENLSDSQVWSKLTGNCSLAPSCQAFEAELKKYIDIKRSATVENKYDNTLPSGYFWYLKDGSMIIKYSFNKTPTVPYSIANRCQEVKKYGGHMCYQIGSFYIDVNGKKKPNIIGRDVHSFVISDDGKIYGVGSKDYALFQNPSSYGYKYTHWENAMADQVKCKPELEGKSDGSNQGCTGRIIEEGWKMNY